MTGGTTLGSDTKTITQAYQKLATHSRNGSVIAAYNDTIEQDGILKYFIDLGKDITSAIFNIDWQGSTVELTLTSPSGEKFTQDNLPANARLDKDATYSFIEIVDPEPGKWQVELHGTDVSTKEQVNLTVAGQSPLMLNSLATGWHYQPPANVLISVKASEIVNDKTIRPKKISLIAKIRKPKPKPIAREGNKIEIKLGDLLADAIFGESEMPLYDDGKHYDGEAGDGVFANVYANAKDQGAYGVKIHCTAETSQGEKIKRELSESFQIGDINANQITLAELLGAK